MTLNKPIWAGIILSLVLIVCVSSASAAKKTDWVRQEADFRISGNSRIKAIYHPKDKPVPTRARKRKQKKDTQPQTITTDMQAPSAIGLNVIDSPPVDGFVPWIAVTTTDEKGEELDLVAVPESSIVGTSTSSSPPDYVIGIFDTGASAHVMGNEAADILDLFTYGDGLVTDNEIEITGVTGSVTTSVSYPLGIFIDSLSAISGMGTLNTSNMVGESNVSIIVGQVPEPNAPDLPTAIGSPMSVFYSTVFDIENPVTIVHDNNNITSPVIGIYEHGDPCIPNYFNVLPLELRPLGGVSVQYTPDFDFYDLDLEDLLGGWSFETPGTPSIIIGNLSQSIFFVHSVDLTEGSNSAHDKNRFMLDTGAQVSVIGKRMGARLGLDESMPDFTVEITGVTGISSTVKGFHIDSVVIPCLGEWLRFTNVPMILLDIYSPEGGTLDGIIGMNLFVEYNFVLKGGGMFLQEDPAIYFEHKDHIIADVAPSGGDGVVDGVDLLAMARSWLTTPGDSKWNPRCDIAPSPTPDGIINQADFAVIAKHWLETQN